jgi:hypothetical protein
MAVYKLFPEKDATLYSEYPEMNTGIDEILEATTAQSLDGTPAVSRFLVKFPQADILDIINTRSTGSLAAYLRTYVAKVEGLSQDTLIYCYPVSGSWANGTGKYLDNPAVENGVSWDFRTSVDTDPWDTVFVGGNATGSWTGSNTGGGNWYTEPDYAQSASFQYRSDFDLNYNVTETVLAWYSGSIINDGFIIKQEDAAEFNPGRLVQFKYFSVDTNTIYPPELQFRWDDYSFNTGSSGQTILGDPQLVVSISNNIGTYEPEAIQKFRLNCRPQYPARVFSTGSFYTTNYYLPTSSYWSLVDLDTNEVVIDFDSSYTRISADDVSSYFDMYMNGLEPERYYKILLKVVTGGATQILDNNYYFKVVNK